jgi:hypothetical protein
MQESGSGRSGILLVWSFLHGLGWRLRHVDFADNSAARTRTNNSSYSISFELLRETETVVSEILV